MNTFLQAINVQQFFRQHQVVSSSSFTHTNLEGKQFDKYFQNYQYLQNIFASLELLNDIHDGIVSDGGYDCIMCCLSQACIDGVVSVCQRLHVLELLHAHVCAWYILACFRSNCSYMCFIHCRPEYVSAREKDQTLYVSTAQIC